MSQTKLTIIMDPFLEREKELLRLNATLDSKCNSLNGTDEAPAKVPSAGNKAKPTKSRGGKGVKTVKDNTITATTKAKTAKSSTQSIKLKMSYEKVDVKSYYEELSKSVWRLDLMNTKADHRVSGFDAVAANDCVGDVAFDAQDMDKWIHRATDTMRTALPPTVVVDETNADVSGGVKEMAAVKTLSNANPIERFLNDFTVDTNQLNIDPTHNAVGYSKYDGGGGGDAGIEDAVTSESSANGT